MIAHLVSGEESTYDETFTHTNNKNTLFLNNGGKIILSGAEILWDLDYEEMVLTSFVNNVLGVYLIVMMQIPIV